MTTIFDIPQELHPEILVRLPVKSLLRCRCVSKSWNSIITSSDFITKHINHNSTDNNIELVRMYFVDTRVAKYSLHSDDERSDSKITDIGFPQGDFNEFFFVVGCVNGLVCLTDSYQRTGTIVLWNPMVRKLLTMVKPGYDATPKFTDLSMGFGYDIQGNDYKFVRVYRLMDRLTVDLVKLSTQQWIEINVPTSMPLVVRDWIGTYFNGVLHWLADSGRLIVSFDLGSETFAKTALPNRPQGDTVWDRFMLSEWRGFLAMVEQERDCDKYCLWVMKEYGDAESWSAQFVVEGFGWLNNVRRNGELLFKVLVGREVAYVDAYDPETKRIRHGVLGEGEPLISLEMMPYIESLLLVNEGTSY